MDIIPAIDLIDGRCVRLTKGDYAQSRVYDESPVDMAKRYADCGVRRIHIVDLDGAKAKHPCNLDVLESVATATGLDIEWGGGVKDESALRSAMDAGASRVIYGSNRLILGADVRDGKVATHGWLKENNVMVEELVDAFIPFGLSQLICTDINKDGMLQGPNYPLYTGLQEKYPAVDVTLSGGISSFADVERAHALGIRAVIVGKAIYEGRITLKDIEQWLLKE